MEKKKMAKALVLTAALAGGMTLAQSFTNEVQATGYSTTNCCLGWGTSCGVANCSGREYWGVWSGFKNM